MKTFIVLALALACLCVVVRAQVPDEWNCEDDWYNEHGRFGASEFGCDCGCGAWDPDCAQPTTSGDKSERYDYIFCLENREDGRSTERTVCGANSECTTIPSGWICEPNWYDELGHGNSRNNAFCDCGCGIYDPDCDVLDDNYLALPIKCEAGNPNGQIVLPPQTNSVDNSLCNAHTAKCMDVPESWFCPANWYDEGTSGINDPACHCACGAYDPDCDIIDIGNPVPTFCQPLSEGGLDDPAESAVCQVKTNTCTDVPTEWLCPKRWWNEIHTLTTGPDNQFDCDCGCGTWDPDCDVDRGDRDPRPNAQAATLPDVPLYCKPLDTERTYHAWCSQITGSCFDVPEFWYCPPRWYNELFSGSPGSDGLVECDCGCGAYDPDCDPPSDFTDFVPIYCDADPNSPEASDTAECHIQDVVSSQDAYDFVVLEFGVCESSASSLAISTLLSIVAALLVAFF